MDRLLSCKQLAGQGAAPLHPTKRLCRRSQRDRSRLPRLQHQPAPAFWWACGLMLLRGLCGRVETATSQAPCSLRIIERDEIVANDVMQLSLRQVPTHPVARPDPACNLFGTFHCRRFCLHPNKPQIINMPLPLSIPQPVVDECYLASGEICAFCRIGLGGYHQLIPGNLP